MRIYKFKLSIDALELAVAYIGAEAGIKIDILPCYFVSVKNVVTECLLDGQDANGVLLFMLIITRCRLLQEGGLS